MKKTTKTIIVVSAVLCCNIILAQRGPVASGSTASGSGGSVTYSVGQVDYITATGTGGKATQGLQQPYEIISTGIEHPEITLSASVYPNPTSDYVILNIDDFSSTKYSYLLYDMQGKLITQDQIINKQTFIPMKDLSNASYVLNVVSNELKIKSFTIIKNY